MEKKIKKDDKFLEPSDNDELDLKSLYRFFLRNKFTVGSFSFVFLILGFLYSFTLRKVWEGQFQIVLDSEKNVEIVDPAIQNFLNFTNSNNDIETQVEILKSPSILMPIYDFARSNSKSVENLSYKNWSNNLDIDLKRGTSILNISYKDTNKDFILPILEKMTSEYQDYSGSSRRRNQELTRKYLKEQINLFKDKSSNSLRSAQEFAIDQDLVFNKTQPINTKNTTYKSSELIEKEGYANIMTNLAIENRRVGAANEIRKINSQLEQINSIGNDYTKLQYIGSTIPGLTSEGLPQTLADLETQLADKRLIYAENDIEIKKYLEKRDFLVNLLKKRAIRYLNAQKMKEESIMQSAKRPKGVILKYKELIREAERDELSLVNLENQLRIFELEEAKYSDPWELITKPTLLKNFVEPSRINISFFAFILGSFIGTLIAFYKEKTSGYIQDSDYLEKFLSVPLLESISLKEQSFDIRDLSFFLEYIEDQHGNEITFLALSKNDYIKIQNLKKFLISEKKLIKKINLASSSFDFNFIKSSENLLLFTTVGNAKYDELDTLICRLNLLNINLNGFVLFN